MSELVVDGRCLVAFLVSKGEGIGMVLVRSGFELLQAEIVEGGVFCLVPKVLRSSLLEAHVLFRPECGIAPEGLPAIVQLSPHPQGDTSPELPLVFSSMLRCWTALRY